MFLCRAVFTGFPEVIVAAAGALMTDCGGLLKTTANGTYRRGQFPETT
jgi:hypothetical protein